MTSGHEIAMSLRSAYLSMHRQTNSFLAPFGITADQFVLLSLLADEDGITQQQLTQRASSDPNTVRAMLVLMENNGMVERVSHPTDGRARCVKLTRKGSHTYRRLSSEIGVLQDHLLNPFAARETQRLVDFLERISGSMAQWERRHNPAQKVS